MVVSDGKPVRLDLTVRPAGAVGMLAQVEGLPEMGYAQVVGDDLNEQLARLERMFGQVNRDDRGYFAFAQRDGGVVAFISFGRMSAGSPLRRQSVEDSPLETGMILAADFRTLTRVKEMLLGKKHSLENTPNAAAPESAPEPVWQWNDLFRCETLRTEHGFFSLYPPTLGGSRAWALWVDDQHVDDFASEAGAKAAATPLGAARGRAKAAVAAAAWGLQGAHPRVAVGSVLCDGQRAWSTCRIAGSAETVEVSLSYKDVGAAMVPDLKQRLLDQASHEVACLSATLPGRAADGGYGPR